MRNNIIVPKASVFQFAIMMIFIGCILGAALGGWVGAHYGFKFGVEATEDKALPLAREQLNKEMETLCSNWFTDKRSKELPEGRIVTCKAPSFLSNPPQK
jgi:hypothetical protein